MQKPARRPKPAVPPALSNEASALCADPFVRDTVWRHAALRGGDASGLDLRTHPQDQMLLHSLRHHQDANASVSQYFNVALQQFHAARQVLRLMFPSDWRRVAFLDFACGYGRLLRFLVHEMPRGTLWASEVQPDALAFVGDAFGVACVPSAMDPADWRPPRRFRCIWVASLFSHLPAELFRAWLRRLHGCLAPDGVLCLSAHDVSLLDPGAPRPGSGFRYVPSSENADLDPASYGTTHVDEAWFRALVAGLFGAGQPCHRIPRGLAQQQDLYVLSAGPDRDLSPLAGFRRGNWGWVDERGLGPGGEIRLRGWAASIDDGPLPDVEIRLDDRVVRCPTGLAREDVAAFFGSPPLATSGWSFSGRPPPGDGPVGVAVSAPGAPGESALLLVGRYPRVAAVAATTGAGAAPGPETAASGGRLRGLLRRLFGR